MRNVGLENIEEAKDYDNLTAGGYVCVITSVEDMDEKEYLKIEFDIAEGEHKGYYKKLNEAIDFWAGNFIRSYKDVALPFFKKFIKTVERCNDGFKFNYDEAKLKNKLIGLVLSEEEYENSYGDIKTKLVVTDMRSLDDIRNGNFKTHPKKLLNQNKTNYNAEMSKEYSGLEPIDDDDLPF